MAYQYSKDYFVQLCGRGGHGFGVTGLKFKTKQAAARAVKEAMNNGQMELSCIHVYSGGECVESLAKTIIDGRWARVSA